jgi:hypothetical protein
MTALVTAVTTVVIAAVVILGTAAPALAQTSRVGGGVWERSLTGVPGQGFVRSNYHHPNHCHGATAVGTHTERVNAPAGIWARAEGGGHIEADDAGLRLRGVRALTVLVDVRTGFESWDRTPRRSPEDCLALAAAVIVPVSWRSHLAAQLTNLEATRARIQEFLQDAKTVDEALRINQELANIEAQIEQTINALQGVNQEELDWKPVQHEKVRSIGDMMRHIVQAEDTFINRFVLGRDVQPRTPQSNPTTESLIADFQALRGRTVELLVNILTPEAQMADRSAAQVLGELLETVAITAPARGAQA